MRVLVLGIRGMPQVAGGVETHAEHLYARLAQRGCNVEVVVRSPYVPRHVTQHRGLRLTRIWSPQLPGLEALVHSLLAVLYAGVTRPDLVHIHAVGPAIVTPLARLLGLRVVVTHHGPDYDRDKWGAFAQWVLRTGERVGMRYAHARIVISRVIAELVRKKHGCDSALIPNGVLRAVPRAETDELERFGLASGRYFLQVSRVVPEKRQLDLIRAFAQARAQAQESARAPGLKLALVGGIDGSDYARSVERAAAAVDGVVLTGALSGAPLEQLYSHAAAFVLPSSHEGLPIVLLEALSYGLPVIASAIPANLELGLDAASYFPVGDVDTLAQRLADAAAAPKDAAACEARRRWVETRYDWDDIAERTLRVYVGLMPRGSLSWKRS
jgi:glycosyltransferase involved in cell wall biosynthesis